MSNFDGGWVVVLVALVLLVTNQHLNNYLRFADLSGLGASSFQSYLTMTLLVGSIGLPPVVGYFSDRVGSRRVTLYGLIILTGAVFLLGMARGLWILYPVTAALTVGRSLSGWVPQMTILSRWFVRRRATAIGLTLMCSSIGGLVLVRFAQWETDPSGWRLIALGMLALATAVLVFARLRDRPEDVGLLPDGGLPATPQASVPTTKALRTRAFWLIVLGDGFASIGVYAITVAVLADTHGTGVSRGTTSIIFLVQACVTYGFYLVGGLVGDRTSKSAALVLFTGVQTLGLVVLALTGSLPLFIMAATIIGMGVGGRAPLTVAALADYFGTGSLGKTLGLFALFSGLLAYVGGPYAGSVRILLGDHGTLLVFAGLSLIGMVLFLKAEHPVTE